MIKWLNILLYAGDLARLMISKEHEFEYWQRYSRKSLFKQFFKKIISNDPF